METKELVQTLCNMYIKMQIQLKCKKKEEIIHTMNCKV